MLNTLAQMMPLALGATFSPSGLLVVMALLTGKEKPKKKALLFVLGAAFFLVIVGQILLFMYGRTIHVAHDPKKISGLLDILAAVLIIAVIGRSVLKGKKEKPKEEKKRRIPYFLVGFLFMLVNTSTLILFIAACKVIADAKLLWREELLLFLVLLVTAMFLISFPVAIALAMPRKSDRVLEPVRRFMQKYGPLVGRIYFFLIAVYLAVHGAQLIRA